MVPVLREGGINEFDELRLFGLCEVEPGHNVLVRFSHYGFAVHMDSVGLREERDGFDPQLMHELLRLGSLVNEHRAGIGRSSGKLHRVRPAADVMPGLQDEDVKP